MRAAGISHGGRGEGPRIHDPRATFAVHRMEAWYRQGVGLSAKLPVLAVYMAAGTDWRSPAPDIELPDGEVHVWRVPLDAMTLSDDRASPG